MILVERNLAQSRERAKAMIMAGKVLVDDIPVDKPGVLIGADARIQLKAGDITFVSRGGVKLEGALNNFNLDVNGMVCMDVGASTGGFTDCLLARGAKKVFAVDVGYGQLAWKLRQDFRVVVIERTNIRNIKQDALPCPVPVLHRQVIADLTDFFEKNDFISCGIFPSSILGPKGNQEFFILLRPQ